MNRLIYLFLLFLTTIILFSCEKEKTEINDIIKKIAISTESPTDISYRNAMAEGNLESTIDKTVIDYGHCWDTIQNPSIYSAKSSFGPQKGSKSFESQLDQLEPGKSYYIRSYYIIADTTVYSQEKSFTTKIPMVPVVVTDSIIIKSVVSVDIIGSVIQINDDSLVERGICWNTSGDPTIDDNTIECGNQNGSFTCSFDELE